MQSDSNAHRWLAGPPLLVRRPTHRRGDRTGRPNRAGGMVGLIFPARPRTP